MPAARLDPRALDEVLRVLPPEYLVAEYDRARLVAGPTGLFALYPSTGDLVHDARAITRAARAVRVALADALTLVPFIDVLVVTTEVSASCSGATATPLDLVESVLNDGHQPLDADTLDRITALTLAQRLPGWVACGLAGSLAGTVSRPPVASTPAHWPVPPASTGVSGLASPA